MPVAYPYFVLMLIIGILAPTRMQDKVIVRFDDSLKRIETQKNFLLLLLLIVIICSFSGFRHLYAPGNDEYAYRNRWDYFSKISFHELNENVFEYIFQGTYWVSTRIFSTNQGGIFLMGTITLTVVLYVLKRDSINFNYAIFLLFATGWLWSSFNGVQQYVSAAIFFLYYRLIIERRWKLYFILTVLCVFIHQAAIFLFIFYFLINKRNDLRHQLILVLLFCFGVVLLYKFVGFFGEYFRVLEAYSDISQQERHGVKIITRLIHCVPAIVGIFMRNRIDKNDELTCFLLNMSCVHMGIMLGAFVDVYIARIAIYTNFFTILLLTRIVTYVRNKTNVFLFKTYSIILYSIVTFLHMQGSLYYFNPELW